MKYIIVKIAFSLISCCLLLIGHAQLPANISHHPIRISSPSGKIQVWFYIDSLGAPRYEAFSNGEQVLQASRLGLKLDDEDFSRVMHLDSNSLVNKVSDSYELFTGKKSHVSYQAHKIVFHLSNSNKHRLDLIFQVSDDGFAFRYYFPNTSSAIRKITEELTSYNFDNFAHAFLQPMQKAKSGWEKTNPAYEEDYVQDIPVGTPSPTGAGWVYPALFHCNNNWVLVTEASMNGSWCATKLDCNQGSGEYAVTFPDEKETIKEDGLIPRSSSPWYSPWRIILAGSLKTIIESTLGTDLAAPSNHPNTSFIQPGKSSWSWIMSKDDSIVYAEQKRYIDFAADMNWNYCLIDVNWDRKIGYDKIKELADYGATKNVGLILWYNSAGNWNTVKYTPKDKLLTHESRMSEFSRIKQMGIKGVKIDFFGGDGQSVIQYYLDILKDAASVGLMVNFHGATLPRGWSRTYPNLVSTEAVRGFEMITFNQKDADQEANHCSMLPFTRNAFDPMDFTPMNLYKITTNVQRKTTSAFELATSVIFLSGIQHYAESPAGMEHVPPYVKELLRQLPARWDDVRFIDGYPGKFVALARKARNKWYIAGINAESTDKEITIDLTQFGKKGIQLITDGPDPLGFGLNTITPSTSTKITIKSNGGFVMVAE